MQSIGGRRIGGVLDQHVEQGDAGEAKGGPNSAQREPERGLLLRPQLPRRRR